MTEDEMRAVRRALDAADDALGALKRFHGFDVSQIALGGLNVLQQTDALAIMARHGFCGEP